MSWSKWEKIQVSLVTQTSILCDKHDNDYLNNQVKDNKLYGLMSPCSFDTMTMVI